MHLGYNTWSMPTLGIDETVELCAGLGFDSLELTICTGWPTDAALLDTAERRRIATLISDSGLSLTGCTGNTPVIGDEASWSAHRAALLSYLDFAAEVRQPGRPIYVTTTTGHEDGVPPENSWEPHRNSIVDRFGELAAAAGERGVTLHLEPNVATACRRPEQALWVLEQVASPSLRLTLDISHFEVQGFDRAAVVRALAPHAGAVEVKDETGLYPDFDFLLPGEGDMDYASFLAELADVGYAGSVSVEVSVYRQRWDDYDPVAAARVSYRVLNQAFIDAGMRRAA